jgi:uncharacterized LabA/DUF88 family protein
MDILVDYDNIPLSIRTKGMRYVAERILATVPPAHLPDGSRCRLRLYGGWYEHRSPTHLAQRLSAELQGSFPTPIILVSPPPSRRLIAAAELAYSIETVPQRHLFHTYRRGDASRGLRAHEPKQIGCTSTDCPVAVVASFVNAEQCPATGCDIALDTVLYRHQQKLVDTMLVIDLVHLAGQRPKAVGIVSSDNDFWPAILTALGAGADVVHVQTKPNQSTPTYYRQMVSSQYSEVRL